MRKRLAVVLWLALLGAGAPAAEVTLAPDGWFRLAGGELFVPLGGFHGNVLPVSRLSLSPEQLRKLKPRLWSDQTTDGQGHLDLSDAGDRILDEWFRQLSANGVTAVRLFARARVGFDVLDLCGKLNPELQAVFQRAFAAARPHGIRFLLQILPEPATTCYMRPASIRDHVRPRYTRAELGRLAPAQRRFILEGKRVEWKEYFTDPDVLACQKRYLAEALDWVASEPAIFALEIFNEQGSPWEEDEIRWSAEIVKTIKQRLPRIPVTLSHPGHGVAGYDPLRWSRGAGVDFYASHLYAGQSGDSAAIDFAAASAATGRIIASGIPNFKGEWGVFDSPVPAEIKRLSHRDAIWLSLLGGEPGFLQWTYEFVDEYRWPAKVMRALPGDFSPAPSSLRVEIGDEYRRFHTNTRYPSYEPAKLFWTGRLLPEKLADANIQRIFAAYLRSLQAGVPVRFTMGDGEATSLERFEALDPDELERPFRAIGGYQMTYCKDARRPLWIAYLRSRRVQGFGGHFVGVARQAPLAIRFHLPPGRYLARLLNLTGRTLESRPVRADDLLPVSDGTDHDYLLLVTGESLKLALD